MEAMANAALLKTAATECSIDTPQRRHLQLMARVPDGDYTLARDLHFISFK